MIREVDAEIFWMLRPGFWLPHHSTSHTGTRQPGGSQLPPLQRSRWVGRWVAALGSPAAFTTSSSTRLSGPQLFQKPGNVISCGSGDFIKTGVAL